jgi:hypothetical protein
LEVAFEAKEERNLKMILRRPSSKERVEVGYAPQEKMVARASSRCKRVTFPPKSRSFSDCPGFAWPLAPQVSAEVSSTGWSPHPPQQMPGFAVLWNASKIDERKVDLKEELELFHLNAEVIICNVLDVGRLRLPLVSPSLSGEIGVLGVVALNLGLKMEEDCFRWWL